MSSPSLLTQRELGYGVYRMESVGNVLKLSQESVHMRFRSRYGSRFGASAFRRTKRCFMGAELHQHSTQCRHLNIKTPQAWSHRNNCGEVLRETCVNAVNQCKPFDSIEVNGA
ncbi:hypothetical protein [Sutterella wadsworthensis]|uniref:hypothetical protein n=1 Tax=Sutterella wadsworthensis TaxID=40545 RepID=UPI0013F64324|nr:hypothetical protein [Sutterella wadsworthensis]